jgi:hypothetical protein
MMFSAKKGSCKSTTTTGSSRQADEERLNQMVRERAYYLWEEKGKPQGQDTEIWLQAKKEIITKLKRK